MALQFISPEVPHILNHPSKSKSMKLYRYFMMMIIRIMTVQIFSVLIKVNSAAQCHNKYLSHTKTVQISIDKSSGNYPIIKLSNISFVKCTHCCADSSEE